MRYTNFKSSKRFTIIEMLVVIAIIMILTAMTLGANAGFMKNRRVDAGGSLIQGILNKARTKAIKEQERQFVGIYTAAGPAALNIPGTAIALPGTANTIVSVDQFGNTSGIFWDQVLMPAGSELIETQRLPELTEFINTPSFGVQFFPDGSCLMIGNANTDWSIAQFNNGVVATPGDVEIQQVGGTETHCYIDILQASGRSRRKLWVP